MSECPRCGDPDLPVEGLCWTCGHRRGYPVLREGEPRQDRLQVTGMRIRLPAEFLSWLDQEHPAPEKEDQ